MGGSSSFSGCLLRSSAIFPYFTTVGNRGGLGATAKASPTIWSNGPALSSVKLHPAVVAAATSVLTLIEEEEEEEEEEDGIFVGFVVRWTQGMVDFCIALKKFDTGQVQQFASTCVVDAPLTVHTPLKKKIKKMLSCNSSGRWSEKVLFLLVEEHYAIVSELLPDERRGDERFEIWKAATQNSTVLVQF